MWKYLELLKALAGDAKAQLFIALDYMAPSHEHRYDAKALYWARRAGESGEHRAYLLAANIIASNGPTAEGWRQIFEAYSAAAQAGDADGQQALAWCYEQGIGVFQNLERELHWLHIAAANGSQVAQRALAWRYAEGAGVNRDEGRSRFYREMSQTHDKIKKRRVKIIVPYSAGGVPDGPDESGG